MAWGGVEPGRLYHLGTAGAQVVLLISLVVLILCVFLTARKDKVCQLAGSPSDDLCHGGSQVGHLEIPCQPHRLSSLLPGGTDNRRDCCCFLTASGGH